MRTIDRAVADIFRNVGLLHSSASQASKFLFLTGAEMMNHWRSMRLRLFRLSLLPLVLRLCLPLKEYHWISSFVSSTHFSLLADHFTATMSRKTAESTFHTKSGSGKANCLGSRKLSVKH